MLDYLPTFLYLSGSLWQSLSSIRNISNIML